MSRIRFAAAVIAVGFAVAACGGGGSGGTGGNSSTTSGGGATTSTTTSTTTSGTTSSTGTGTPTKPEPPHLDSVKPLNGGLGLTWTEFTTCDTVEAERKDGIVSYMVVVTVNGGIKMAADPGATQDQNYTYRLRCKTAGVYSDYSNELTANPKMP